MSKNNFKVITNPIPHPSISNNNYCSIFQEVAPHWLKNEWGRKTISENEFPEELTLRIAENCDVKKVLEFFDSRKKTAADPNNFVKPRPDESMDNLTRKGRIAIIEDHNDDIVTICFAFSHKVNKMSGHTLVSGVTEIGTVLSCAKGLGLTSVAISMLALHIQEKEGADHPIIAKVSAQNPAANKLFTKSLKWETNGIKGDVNALFKSSVGDTMRDNKIDSRNWYVFKEKAEDTATDLISQLETDKVLIKGNHKIPFIIDDELRLNLWHKKNTTPNFQDITFNELDLSGSNYIPPLIDDPQYDLDNHLKLAEVINL